MSKLPFGICRLHEITKMNTIKNSSLCLLFTSGLHRFDALNDHRGCGAATVADRSDSVLAGLQLMQQSGKNA
jgi:hypothetical protein